MLTRTPKRLIQCSSSGVAVVSAVWSDNGTASYHFMKSSPNNAISGLPVETGSGPRESISMWQKRKLGGLLTKVCLCFCLWLLRCWQTGPIEANILTSFTCPGQTNLVRSLSNVFITPMWATVAELWIDSKSLGRNVVGTTCCKWLWPESESSKPRHGISFATLRESKMSQRTHLTLDCAMRLFPTLQPRKSGVKTLIIFLRLLHLSFWFCFSLCSTWIDCSLLLFRLHINRNCFGRVVEDIHEDAFHFQPI